jgi:hypothetical protein
MSELIGKHLHFDCASGCAGDMTLGALFHAGVPEEVVRDALVALGVDPDRLTADRIVKRGVTAVDVKVRVDDVGDDGHGHGHGHDHHHWSAIEKQIRESSLSAGIIERALDMFSRVARAEATIHGVPVEDVAFHEVGALDSIVDIVGTAAALDWLQPASATATSVAMGHGTLECAHGIMPVPAPAALEIMREAGGVMDSGGLPRELCTPTGAAILAATITAWEPMPRLRAVAFGCGAGDADLRDRANVIRVTIGERVEAAASDSVVRIEANVDDMSPEMCEHVADTAFAAGAVDVWWTPIVMKKSRPALLISALAPAEARDAVTAALFRETTTIGVRFAELQRQVLEREIVEVDTAYGAVAIKVSRRDGHIVNAAPEYEVCRKAASDHEVPLKRVFAAAVAAFERYRED